MSVRTRSQMLSRYSRRGLEAAVARGEVHRAGRWFVTPDEPEVVTHALEAGARLTCVTAARQHGLWTPASTRIHAYSTRSAELPAGWVGHGWHERPPEPDPIASPALVLRHAAGCLAPVDVGILADSALHQGLLTEADVAAVGEAAPRPVRPVLRRASGLAESGTESRVRYFFALKGVPVQAQVPIDGTGRVDLLVGSSWIIECDSREHHADQDAYERDRERDGGSHSLGYLTTRLTYDMVERRWRQTTARLLAVLRTGEHLRKPSERARARRRG